MTTQDLIIGHYEGTLTGAEQTQLEGLMATSPETRMLFEQHGLIEEHMREESEELAPPFGLREATLGAALTTAATTIGGGVATWLSGKLAIILTTVVIGGAAVGLGIGLGGDDDTANGTPGTNEAVPTVVTTPEETAQPSAEPTEQPENVVKETGTATVTSKPVTSNRSVSEGGVGTDSKNINKEKPNPASTTPPLTFGKENAVTMEPTTTVKTSEGSTEEN